MHNNMLNSSVMNTGPFQISGALRKLLTRAFIYDVIALILKQGAIQDARSASSVFFTR